MSGGRAGSASVLPPVWGSPRMEPPDIPMPFATEGPMSHDGIDMSRREAPAFVSRSARHSARRAAPRDAEPSPPTFARFLGRLALLLVIAAAGAFVIRTFVVEPFLIPSASMEDTLRIGDGVLVNRFVYRFEAPRPGDIVVFASSSDSSTDLIKRVVAVGGQTVDVRDGVVYVDGRRMVEPYVNRRYPDHFDSDAPVKVPPGTVFVMGDNRANSADSRYIGPQPVSAIVGRAFAIYWPLSRIKLF